MITVTETGAQKLYKAFEGIIPKLQKMCSKEKNDQIQTRHIVHMKLPSGSILLECPESR